MEGDEGLRSRQSKKSSSGESPGQPLLRAGVAFRAAPSQARWSGFPALRGSFFHRGCPERGEEPGVRGSVQPTAPGKTELKAIC